MAVYSTEMALRAGAGAERVVVVRARRGSRSFMIVAVEVLSELGRAELRLRVVEVEDQKRARSQSD